MTRTSFWMIAVMLCSGVARAQESRPLIERPLTLERGGFALTLHGTYTNWGTGGLSGGASSGSVDGETIALGFDYGVTDQAQLGLALALPVNPGAGFGSVLGNAMFAVSPTGAVRVDAGFENAGVNGGNGLVLGGGHISRYFAGLGARIVAPISPTVAFVTGRGGAAQFGHFNNVGVSGSGFYSGATIQPDASADFLVVSAGNNQSPTIIGLNLPAGLLFQVDPNLAVTLLAGYSGVLRVPDSGSSDFLHFVPIGVEAAITPAPSVETGLRFFFDGYVGHSGGSGTVNGPNYFDLRALMLWFRFRG